MIPSNFPFLGRLGWQHQEVYAKLCGQGRPQNFGDLLHPNCRCPGMPGALVGRGGDFLLSKKPGRKSRKVGPCVARSRILLPLLRWFARGPCNKRNCHRFPCMCLGCRSRCPTETECVDTGMKISWKSSPSSKDW